MSSDETVKSLEMQCSRLLREGRVIEGIEAHRRLLALKPDLPESWFNLAYLQRCMRQFAPALDSYGEALARGIRGAEEVHVNRAAILSEHLERGEEAEEELHAALRINPGFITAWLNLGNLYEDWGDKVQARETYAQVLEITPDNARAHARLAALDIFDGAAGDAVSRLSLAMESPGLARQDAAEIGFALGAALDATGAYDDAFEAIADANRRVLRGTIAPYVPEAHAALVDRLTRIFPVPAANPIASPIKPPLFICGMFRSGSTLAERILAKHSRVTAAGELEFIPAIVHDKLQPYPEALASLSAETIAQLRQDYIDNLRVVHPTIDLVTDKRPDNFLHIGLIKRLFPEAKIIHTTRNALDNILSIYFLHFHESINYGFDLADIAHWYGQYLKVMAHWKSVYPDDIYDFDYDLAVADPEPAIAGLLAFCGLEWEDACLAAPSADSIVRTASAWQVRQPLHARSSGRWRHYESQLAEIRAALPEV